MKKTLIFLLTITLTQSWAQQAEKNETASTQKSIQHVDEFTAWFNQLNHHLLESENNYHVAMGVAAMLNGALNQMDQSSAEAGVLLPQLTNILNELIAQSDLSIETLDLLTVWCFKPSIQSNCDQQTLLEKRMEQQSENLNAYFKSLQIAVEQNDQGLGIQTMQLMSMAKYSRNTINTSAGFNKIIDEYIDKNPLPESYINALTNDKKLMSQTNLKDYSAEQLIQNFAKTAIKMAYAMFYEAPDLRPLFFLCKTNIEFKEQCLAITELLINKSNTINAKGQGYAILLGIHENQENKALFNVVKEKQEKYRDYLQCLSKATQSANPVNEIFDPEYQKIQLANLNELDKVKQLAQYVYNKYKDSNPEQTNPETCDSK